MLEASSSPLEFGNVESGTTSTKTFTLTNISNSVINNFTLNPQTTYGSTWTHTTTCGATLAAGASCTVSVTLAPSGGNSALSNYILVATTPHGTQNFASTGFSVSPITTESNLLVFRGPVGQIPQPVNLTIRNTSPNRTFTHITVYDPYNYGFSSSASTCSNVAPGASCVISVSYNKPVPAVMSSADYFQLAAFAEGINGGRITVSVGPE